MADVEHHADEAPLRDDGLRDRQAGELRQHLGGLAGVEMVGEVVDGLVGGLEETERLGLERQRHGAAGALFEIDQAGRHAHDMLGVAVDHGLAGDVRLEAQRRALDRRRYPDGHDVGQDLRDVHGVLRALLGAPVRLVDLLLDDLVLERPVGEGVDRVEIHVVVGEEAFELVALGLALDQRRGRRIRQPQRHAERRGRADALLHLRHVGGERRPHVLPGVAGMHERRIGQVAEALAEIHCCSSF